MTDCCSPDGQLCTCCAGWGVLPLLASHSARRTASPASYCSRAAGRLPCVYCRSPSLLWHTDSACCACGCTTDPDLQPHFAHRALSVGAMQMQERTCVLYILTCWIVRDGTQMHNSAAGHLGTGFCVGLEVLNRLLVPLSCSIRLLELLQRVSLMHHKTLSDAAGAAGGSWSRRARPRRVTHQPV